MSLTKKVNLSSEVTGSLPAASISGYAPVTSGALLTGANQAARLASAAVAGDSYLQQDTAVRWLLITNPATTAGNWQIWDPGGPNASSIGFVPAGGVAATEVQAAITEVDAEKATFAQIQNQSLVAAADTGAADAYAIAVSPAIAAYVSQQRFSFKAANTNTGTSTLNVNALGVKTIKKNVSDNLLAGDIVANQQIEVVYDGTNFQLVSRAATTDLPYIKLSDTKAAGTEGGTPTAGSFQTHTINTEDTDTGGLCTLAANQFTLAAGTYTLDGWASFYKSNRAQIKIRNATDASDVLVGSSEYSDSPNAVVVKSRVQGRFTIAAGKALELQYQVGSAFASQGLGVACNFGISEVYAVIVLNKVA